MKFFITCIIFLFTSAIVSAQSGCMEGNCDNGKGTYKFENKDLYAGEWKNGNRTGYGRYDWTDGSYYIGYFLNNLLHGQGSYYSASGNDMIGWFIENNFQGSDKPENFEVYNKTADEIPADDEASLSKLLEEWESTDAENEKTKATHLRSATYADFISVMETVVKDFENNFENLKGPEEQTVLDLGDSWFSNIIINGTDDALIISGALSDHNTWYNILFKAADFYTVKRKYEEYVTIFNEKFRSECCTLVYDKYDDYKSDNYESYGTYWITFLVNDGYNDVYDDLLIEIEMTSGIIDGGYQVLARVSHLSDK